MWYFVPFLMVVLISVFESQGAFDTESKSFASSITEKFQQHDYKIKFERYEVINFNKQFLRRFDAVTFKYNRSLTTVNVSWIYIKDIGNEFDVVIQAYKFASNEYRLFPARFRIDFCDGFRKNIIGIRNSIRCGNFAGCPMIKNVHVKVCNWSPDESMFPPMVPNGSYMVEIEGMFRSTKLFVVRGYGTVYRPIIIKK